MLDITGSRTWEIAYCERDLNGLRRVSGTSRQEKWNLFKSAKWSL